MEDEPLDILAKKADRIMEQRSDAPGSVAAITTPVTETSTSSVLSIGEVNAVRRLLRHDGRGQPRVDDRGASRGARGPSETPFTCRNHAKWGTKSFSCKPGCLLADLPLARRPGNSNAGR